MGYLDCLEKEGNERANDAARVVCLPWILDWMSTAIINGTYDDADRRRFEIHIHSGIPHRSSCKASNRRYRPSKGGTGVSILVSHRLQRGHFSRQSRYWNQRQRCRRSICCRTTTGRLYAELRYTVCLGNDRRVARPNGH